MKKYQITVGGKHSATLEIGEGQSFTGSIASDEFGTGTLSGARDGDNLSGSAYIDSHHANFSATAAGSSISGSLSAFFFREDFTGTLVEPPEQETQPGTA